MNVSTELSVVITVSEKELLVAQHSGLVVPHPSADRMILWAPSGSFDDLPIDCEHITTCLVTKNTESDLKENGRVPYRTSDPDHTIVFMLEEGDSEVSVEGGDA